MKYLVLVLTIAVYSCSPSKKEKQLYFFDFSGFINTEIAALKSDSIKLKKTIRYDGNEQTKIISLDSVQLRRELTPFIELDINRPSWRDSYVAGTVADETGYTLIYTGDETVEIKKASVWKDNDDKAFGVQFYRTQDNATGNIETRMWYDKTRGYNISVEQNINFVSKKKYEIIVRFI